MKLAAALALLSLVAGVLLLGVGLPAVELSPIQQSPQSFWEVSTPEEEGVDSDLLAAMLERVRDEHLRVRSVLIVRNSRLVLESYTHPYGEDVVHDVKSVSKSVISSLVGIALREGSLQGLDQTVYEFFPEYFPADSDLLKRSINLTHLLTMASGLDLDENGPVMREIMPQDDWIRASFARPMIADPGAEFRYCSFLTHTMSGILTRASRTDLLALGYEYLFAPLGITDVHWEKGPDGYYMGGDRLWLTPRDMAKFGLLFLNVGRWGGRQVVPENWVREATRNRFTDFDADGYSGYGYWWWLSADGSYRARGAFGQIISVYPERKLVVVFTGADNGAWELLTDNYILPAVSGADRLPTDAVAHARLLRVARELRTPAPQPPRSLPKIAGEISGRTYTLGANELDFSQLTLWFDEPDAGRLQIGQQAGVMDLAFGLDNVYRVTEGVGWGARTDRNVFALRGEWTGENEFSLELHEVGEPFYFEVTVTFQADRLEATFVWQPFNWRVPVGGHAI
jgi:CubicO group peptidase (beta-lactamase class C family)